MIKINKLDLQLIFGLILFFVLIYLFEKKNRKEHLKKSRVTYAIFCGYNGGVGDSKPYFRFVTYKGEQIETSISHDKRLAFGDTVWIEYSEKDPEIAEIIDEKFNKK